MFDATDASRISLSHLDRTEVEQAVVFFIHCFRVNEPAEQIARNLRAAGYETFDCINPDPDRPKAIYFEQEVYELFAPLGSNQPTTFKPKQPLTASTVEHNLPVTLTPVIYLLAHGLLLIALRVEFDNDPKPCLDRVMRFVEAFRYCVIRHFQGSSVVDRQLKIDLTVEARQLQFDEQQHIAEAYHLVTRIFRLAVGRDPTSNDIVFGNFGKLFGSLFYRLGGELTPEDRHHIIHFDRPANPDNPKDWHDPLPAQALIDYSFREQTYHRWEEQKQFFGFMPFGFTMFLEPCDERSPVDASLPFYFEHRYHVIYLILLAEITFLHHLKSRLMRLEAQGLSRKRLSQQIERLRQELLKFSNHIWSSRISYEIQGSELFELGRKVLGVEKLYEEVHGKLVEYDEYLETWRQGQINKGLWILQWWLLPLVFGGFLVTLMQLKPATDWLTKTFIPPWPDILQIAISVILPFPLAALVYGIYAIFRKVRQ